MNIEKSLKKIVRERENRKRKLVLNLLVLVNVFIFGILVGGFFIQNELVLTGKVTGNLPDVGESNWGTILNNYLLQEHTVNGSHGNITAESLNVSGNITTDNYIGAGIQNPGSPLDIVSENIRGLRIREEDLSSHFEIYVSSTGIFSILRGTSSFVMGITNTDRVGIEDSTPDAKFEVQHSGSGDAFRVDDLANDPTPFIINQDGDVGIGTAFPSTKLDVNGSVKISGNVSGTPDANTLYAKSLPKAWVNFDGTSCSGTGNTCTLRDSFNVDNVTRVSTGNFTIYWDRDFASNNYTVVCTTSGDSGDTAMRSCVTDHNHLPTQGSYQVMTSQVNDVISRTSVNNDINTIIAFGEQS